MTYDEIRQHIKTMPFRDMIRIPVLNEIIYNFADLEEEKQEELCDRIVDYYIKTDDNFNPIYFVICLFDAREMIKDMRDDYTNWDYVWEKGMDYYYG